MDEIGAGNGSGQHGRKPDDVFARPGEPAPKKATPEQGCFLLLGIVVLLLVSLAFWGWYYWQNNPEFHLEKAASSVSKKSPSGVSLPGKPPLNP